MLEVKQLAVAINKKPILNQVDFQVPRGEVAIFLGGSGVGKSTLLRVLNDLQNYDHGEFLIDGKPIDIKKRDHTVGMVFQHFNLFEHLTVEENITLPLIKLKKISKEQARGKAGALLEKYGLAERKSAAISQLSGGQKQRLAIARTLALNPTVICLDEPTSALDPRLTSQVATAIQECAAEGRIVLLTTHDMALVDRLSGHLFLMNNGSIVERATTEEYRREREKYTLLYRFLNPEHSI